MLNQPRNIYFDIPTTHRRHPMRTISTLLIAFTFIASSAFAQPLADKVPANPLIYVGWRGSDDLGPAYADSHTKALLAESNIPAVFNDMVPRAVARVARENAQAGEALRIATKIAGTMWHHPTALVLADMDLSGNDPMPKAAVLCQAGNDSKALLAQFENLLKKADGCPVPMRAYQSSDITVFSIGYAENEDVVAIAASKPLASESAFTAAMGNVQKDPVVTVYLNVEHLVAHIDEAVEKKNDEHAKEYWPKIRDASGLAGVKRFIATGGFDGKDWMQSAYIEAPSPRAGLVTMLDSTPLDDDLLKLAPENSDEVVAGTFNIAKLISTIRAAIAQVNPDAGAMVDKGIGAVSLYVGRDFQKEVLEPIGEHWLAYSSPTVGGRGLLGLVVVNRLNDPKKAEQGIMATQLAAFNTAAGFLARQNITLRAQNLKSGDLSINYVAVPLISPAWCVNNGKLYLAMFPQNIITAAHFSASGGKSILDNSKFTDLRKRLNAPDKIHSIRYYDLTQTAGEGYQALLAVSRLGLGMGDLFGVRSPEPVIPPLDVLLKHVGPSGGVTWVDDSGWHARCISSFPGAEILGGGCGAAAIAPALGVILPALGKARHRANNVADLSNLRQIGLACLMYSQNHGDTLPDSLEQTSEYVNDPHVYVGADHADSAKAIAALPKDQWADWIKEHADYVYAGKGQKLSEIKHADESVLAFRPAEDNQGQAAVVFVDGHAEVLSAHELQAKMGQ
jgi:hypothetical protein